MLDDAFNRADRNKRKECAGVIDNRTLNSQALVDFSYIRI